MKSDKFAFSPLQLLKPATSPAVARPSGSHLIHASRIVHTAAATATYYDKVVPYMYISNENGNFSFVFDTMTNACAATCTGLVVQAAQ